MLISDDFGFMARALSQCEAYLENTRRDDDPNVIVGNHDALLRVVRIAKSLVDKPHVSCAELAPFLGEHWCIVKQRRPDRPRFARCGAELRQILPREYAAAERAAIEARFPAA